MVSPSLCVGGCNHCPSATAELIAVLLLLSLYALRLVSGSGDIKLQDTNLQAGAFARITSAVFQG